MKWCDVIIVGGGPAGLAAAARLRKHGVDFVLLEREQSRRDAAPLRPYRLYGLGEFRRLMTGPSYARRLVEGHQGLRYPHGDDGSCACIPAVSFRRPARKDRRPSRERSCCWQPAPGETPRSARLVTGARPAGVMNTATLQQAIYLHGKTGGTPGGDRQELVAFSTLLTLRHIGVKPVAMIESGPRIRAAPWRVGGPPRLWRARLLQHPPGADSRVDHVEGVELDRGYGAERLDCDGVVFTGQFRPETALFVPSHLAIDPGTRGPAVDQFWRCSDPAYFAAGNLLRGIETAGRCYREGRAAADAVLGALENRLPPVPQELPRPSRRRARLRLSPTRSPKGPARRVAERYPTAG